MLFLANLIGCNVHGKAGEEIGRLEDLIVRIGDSSYPPISGMVVRDRRRSFFIPAAHLAVMNGSIQLNSSVVDLQPFQRRDGEVLLGKDVLDHQIIDITGRRIVRVNDIQLALLDRHYRIVGVDVSAQALLRRLGPRFLADKVIGRQLINWADVQYLASAAPVQLRVSYDRLSEMNPVDLARIMDALSYRESAEIVAALDDETAAETLEEISDERLIDLLEGMDPERAADILEEMTPNAAADVLDDLSDEVAEELLARMEPEEAADVQELLAYDEDRVGRIMTTDFVSVPADITIGDAIALLRSLDEVPDPLLAIYVVGMDDPHTQQATPPITEDHAAGAIIPTLETVDALHEPGEQLPELPITPVLEDERAPFLHGVVRLRNLLLAEHRLPLREVMEDDIPSVHPKDPAREAARVLGEYNLLAVPVLDDERRLIGIVTVDDALAVLLPEIWQRRGSRSLAA